MFNILYYTILIACSLASCYIFSKQQPKVRRTAMQLFFRRLNYGVLLAITLSLWAYQIALWVVPKGTTQYETLRIPQYGSKLSSVNLSGMIEETYPFGKDRRQYLMYFEPENGAITQDRVVYFVHGGSWRMGSPELYRPAAQFFVKRGYAVIITAYRLAPQYNYLDMREDLNQSMKKVLTILKSKQLHRKKILLAGDSAGANLAALLLYDRKNLAKIGMKQSKFDCFISFAGPLNLNVLSPSQELTDFAGTPQDSTFQQANPYQYIQKNEKTPVLCFHGTKDGYVNYNCSKTFVQKLNKVRSNLAQLVTLDNESHINIIGDWIYDTDSEIHIFLNNWLDDMEKKLKN